MPSSGPPQDYNPGTPFIRTAPPNAGLFTLINLREDYFVDPHLFGDNDLLDSLDVNEPDYTQRKEELRKRSLGKDSNADG